MAAVLCSTDPHYKTLAVKYFILILYDSSFHDAPHIYSISRRKIRTSNKEGGHWFDTWILSLSVWGLNVLSVYDPSTVQKHAGLGQLAVAMNVTVNGCCSLYVAQMDW